MTENEFSIYDLLDKVRDRPMLYTGVVSITLLSRFVEGYRFALLDHGFKDVSDPSWMDFHFWARARLNQEPLSLGWPSSILEACGGDEAQAVGRFYEMLDEYRRGQFPGLVEQWRAEWSAIREAQWEAEAEQEARGG